MPIALGYNDRRINITGKVLLTLKRSVRLLTVLSCIGMFLVLLAGAAVTKMDAGRGCGDDWPLCNRKFIPAYTVESMLEYSHRFVSGVVGILVVITFIAVWRHMSARKDAVFYAASALVLTIVQAALGAAAVMKPQSDAVLALHFGISLLAFASTLLLVVAVRQRQDQLVYDYRYSTGYRYLIYLSIIYCYIVVYTGAYVRHTESFGGCVGWPLCNGEWIPELTGATGVMFLHRLASLVILIMIFVLTWLTLRNREIPRHMRKSAIWASVFIALQVLSGGLVTFALGDENTFIFTAMIHTSIISALFSILCYMGIEAWRSEKEFVTEKAEAGLSKA